MVVYLLAGVGGAFKLPETTAKLTGFATWIWLRRAALETPFAPPNYLKEAALLAALRSILVHYSQFIAYAPNL